MLLTHEQDNHLAYPKNSVNLAAKVDVAGGQEKVAVPPKIGHVKTLSQAGRGMQNLAPEVEPLVLEF